jgi:DNA gyrase subunit A
MVQRTQAGGISQMGRATQGVKVMNIRDDDRLVAVALVVESGSAVAGAEDSEPAPSAPGQAASR